MLTNSEKKLAWMLGGIYIAFLEVTSLGNSLEISPCIIVSQEQASNNQSSNQTCAAMHEAIFMFGRFIWSNASHDNVLAFGTVMIALFTLTLWWSTTKLWKAGERHSERELRAYVLLERTILETLEVGKNTTFKIMIKNTGQTPAKDATLLTAIVFADLPLRGTISFVNRVPYFRGLLGPGQTVNHTVIHPDILKSYRRILVTSEVRRQRLELAI